jgi:predicted CXXCH cytochrome family protein
MAGVIKRMNLRVWLPFLIVFISVNISIAQTDPQSNQNCLRCHSMATLGFIDSTTGNIVNLSVNPDKFAHSNHKALKCVDCHNTEFETFPHPASLKSENLYCLNCHEDQGKFAKFRFPEIGKEFQQSVHHTRLPDEFTCFTCHDPHEFDISDVAGDVGLIIYNTNQLCLGCHNSPLRFSSLTSREFPDIAASHAWLPNAELHWRNVRCVECHTPHEEFISHNILPADKAEKLCAECHTANSILMAKLYRYQTKEAREKNGFINSVALNNAYIIGMTRNLLLDRLSVVIFGLALFGIILHAGGRAIGSRRKKS